MNTLGAFRTFCHCVTSAEQMSRVHNCCKVWQRNEKAFVDEFHQRQSFQLLINRVHLLSQPQPIIVVLLALQDVFLYTEELRKDLGLGEIRGCD